MATLYFTANGYNGPHVCIPTYEPVHMHAPVPRQVVQLTSDLEGAQDQLTSEASQYSLFQQQSSEQLEKLQSDVEALHADLICHTKEKELLERTSNEQRAELVRLRLAVSELELREKNLLFQTSNSDGTIGSLQTQV